MAAFLTCGLLVLATISQVANGQTSTVLLGGASSFAELGPVVVTATGKNLPAYASTSSGTGISSFTSGTYATAASDDPMTLAQETASPAKFTIPIVIASYGFFVQGNGKVNISMTWLDLFNAFKTGGVWTDALTKFEAVTRYNASMKAQGRVQQIGKLAGSGGKGVSIKPISRQGNSGTTLVIKKFFEAAANNDTSNKALISELLTSSPPALEGTQFPSSWVCVNDTRTVKTGENRLQNGGPVLCSTLNSLSNIGFVGYSQKNLCAGNATNTTSEIFVRNRAGFFRQSTGADTQIDQVTPRSDLKIQDKGWYANLVTVYLIGEKTPPIASFVFIFSRQSYTKATTYKTQLTITGASPGKSNPVSIFDALIRQTRSLGSKYGFTPLASKLTDGYYATVKALTKFV